MSLPEVDLIVGGPPCQGFRRQACVGQAIIETRWVGVFAENRGAVSATRIRLLKTSKGF